VFTEIHTLNIHW